MSAVIVALVTGLLACLAGVLAPAANAADRDHDGLSDRAEQRHHTALKRSDTDRDGLSDGAEVKRYKTNPLRKDTDRDGITDGAEVFPENFVGGKVRGFVYGMGAPLPTNPRRADSDNDGLSDRYELSLGTNPTLRDTDGDNLYDGREVKRYGTNPLSADTDGDGYSDGREVFFGSNPRDGNSPGKKPVPKPPPTTTPEPPPTTTTPPPPPADTTAPLTTITASPDSSTTATTATFEFNSNEDGSTFACRLDDGAWSNCASPRALTGLAVGAHTFDVRATDEAGNTDATPSSRTWTVTAPTTPDTTAPNTSITTGPTGTVESSSASFSFTATEAGSTFQCRVDGASWSSCATPKAYSGLADGSHSFAVRAIDAASNVDASPATSTWTVASAPPEDTTPPQTTIDSGPSSSTTSVSATLTFSSSESGSSFACRMDGGAWGNCSSPISYASLAVGNHSFDVRATDAAGNTDATPATEAWTITAVTPPPPPPPPGDCDQTVSSTSAAQSAVSSAQAGDVVCLANGTYGRLTLNASKQAPGVTVRAQNPGQATIGGATLSGSYLTIARFVSTSGINLQPGSVGMVVDHNKITGGGQGIDTPSTTTPISDFAITNNQFVGPFGEDAIHLNRYHDGSDADSYGALIEGNEFTNIRENGNHSDCLQTVYVGDHLYFRRNYEHDNACQGFFIKDQASTVDTVVVEDNLIIRNAAGCIPSSLCPNFTVSAFQLFGPITNLQIKRNTIWTPEQSAPTTFREDGYTNVSVTDNVIYRAWSDSSAPFSSYSASNNTACTREGTWPATGFTSACSPPFPNAAAGDYRISGRGVTWAVADQHFGP